MATKKTKATPAPAPEVVLHKRYRVCFVGRVYITADVAGGALNAKELYHMSSYDSRWLDQQAAKQRIDWEVDSVGVSYSAEQEGVSL